MTLPETTARALPALASEIRQEVDAAERAWQDGVGHAIRAGELLLKAKAQVKHGEWLPWLEANFPGSERSARNYMRLAANRQRVADLPTIREAVAALAEVKPRREATGRLDRAADYISEAEDCYRLAFEEFGKAGIVFGPTSLKLPDDLPFEDLLRLGRFLASIAPEEAP
jgi:hypothetical protein